MTYAYQTRAAQSGLALEIAAGIHHLIQRVADYRAYRATLAQLSRLNDQTLTDLGLHRSEIRRVAYESTYGTRM